MIRPRVRVRVRVRTKPCGFECRTLVEIQTFAILNRQPFEP